MGSRHDGPVMVIDSDIFPIRPFSVQKTLESCDLAGVYWGAEDAETHAISSYLWLALIFFNNPRLPERETICFNCGLLPGTAATFVDSGGWTYFYLNKHRDALTVKPLDYVQGHHFFCPYRYASPEAQQWDHLSAEEIAATLTARGFTAAEVALALRKPYTIELLDHNRFLHYRAGTNYEGYSDEFLAVKDQALTEFFEEILR
jgi:hypothetical protein